MHDTEAIQAHRAETIRLLHAERDDARLYAAIQRNRADTAEAKLREARAEWAAKLNGDWTEANPVVRELREDVDWDKLGLELIVRDGKGWVERDGTNLSLCASSPGEVLAWVDGFDTAVRAGVGR